MKNSLKQIMVVSAVAFTAGSFSLPLFSHQSDQSSYRGGMMQNYGHMGMMGHMGGMGMMGHMRGLDMMGYASPMGMTGRANPLGLSEEQRQATNKLHGELRKKHWEIMGQLIDQHSLLGDAYALDRPDPKAIGAVYGKIFDLRRQMIEAAIDTHNKKMDMLNEEQIGQLKQFQNQMMGPSGMMESHGMMGGCHMMQDQ